MTGLRTRTPTGQVAWPLILVEGAEKSGKSVAAYSLSGDPRVGRTFVLDLGEGTADEYARLGRYEVIDHNGTYSDMEQQIRFACAEPFEPGVPNVIEIDSGSAVWDLLKDWTNHRARNSRTGRRKLHDDPDAEIDPSMNLWNDARDRWYRIINQLRRSGCIGVIICRAREVALVKDGQPVEGKTDYKVEAEKGTPFAVTAQVRMSLPHTATLVAVRSLDVALPEGGLRLADDNPLGHLVFDVLGCGTDTVAAQITHASVGLSKNEAKQRLLALVTRSGFEDPESAKAKASVLWSEYFPAEVEEVAPARMAEVLDAVAEVLEDTTEGAGADDPASDGDAALSGDGADGQDVGRTEPEPAPATQQGEGEASALHGASPDPAPAAPTGFDAEAKYMAEHAEKATS